MKKHLLYVVPVAVIVLIGIFIVRSDSSNSNNQEKLQLGNSYSTTLPPQVTIIPTPMPSQDAASTSAKMYSVTLSTSVGDITLELSEKTPKTTGNFVTLAQKGFYDNTIFHRVINGFMIQGGDPKGDGTGGPGYKFDDEPFTGEYTRGTIAMANAGPNTNGSQFFIMHADNPLPKNYVIFGKVTKGIEVVDKIATAEVGYSPMGERSKPISPVIVKKVIVLESK